MKRSSRVFFAVSLIGLLGSIVAPAGAQAKPLAFEDLRRTVGVSSPQISPDGKRIVYVRSRTNWKDDRTDSELVLVDVASGASRTLTHERPGVSSPRWSPAGDRIAFASSAERGKPPQVYAMPMSGGDALKVTDAKAGVQSFAWRPDGGAIAYVTSDEPVNKKQIDEHNDAFVVTDEHFLVREKATPSHIWLVDADGTNAKRLTSGTWSLPSGEFASGITWTPDGKGILYARQPDAVGAHFIKAQLMIHDIAANSDRAISPGRAGGEPVISHDGTLVALPMPRHQSPYLQNDLHVLALADAKEQQVTLALDRNVHWSAFMPGDKTLAIATADGVRNVLWMQPIGAAPAKVDLGDVDFDGGASIANDGGIAFVGETMNAPRELYYLAPATSVPRRLTNENAWVADYAIGKSEKIEWDVAGGFRANGVLTYPPGYVAGKKYPLVLEIHGGPVSTSTQDFSGFTQVLAARGFIVLQPNYRGSDNLGDAYLQAIVGHVTSGPAADNLAGLAAVEKLGIVDESKIGVSGWSGGGLQTSWLIGHAHMWKAAVSGAAVNDWIAQSTLADINMDFGAAFIPGPGPYTAEGRKAYLAESPITFARDIKTPTLILSDTGDQRVPIVQSYALYHALKDNHVPVRFTAFPRAGHFPADPVGREMAYRAWADWFSEYLK